MRPGVVALALAAALHAAAAAAQPTSPGRYDGQLCVATHADVAPSCGAAEVELASRQRLSVRISDVVYRLQLHSAQLDVTMMQGRMQIDEFSAAYLWRGDTLLFGDPAKDARYEIRVGAKRAPARR